MPRPRTVPARPTWWWSCSTTSASRSSAATAPTSPPLRSTAWPTRGVRLTNFHTTAVCSPTRACLLTGRNHHRVGVGMLPDLPMNFPGYTARIPDEAGTLAQILRDEGYATFAVGKWHLTPARPALAVGPVRELAARQGLRALLRVPRRRREPLGAGAGPRQHLRRPAPHARRGLPPERGPGRRDHRPAARAAPQPARPTVPGLARHGRGPRPAPRHPRVERRRTPAGSTPAGTSGAGPRSNARSRSASSRPAPSCPTPSEHVPDWDGMDPDQRRVAARMMEVYAGFLTHADAQIGRVLAALDELGERDNTVVVVVSDNGASGEAGPARFGQRVPVRPGSRRGPRAQPGDDRRARRATAPTTTTRGAGPRPATRRSGASSATRSRAACATRSSSRGPPGSTPPARSATSTATRSTCCRRCSTCSTSTRPSSSAVPSR